MKIRQFTNVAIFWILIGISLGCSGQPRVTVITSTMVGLEAKPPMGDGQPNPSVNLAYKRAEMALVPVCRVPEYSWWQEFMEWLGLRDKKNSEQPPSPVGAENISGKVGSMEGKSGQQADLQCPPMGSKGADSYTVLGSFQMAHNWFGPLNIRQFIATGMAARHLVTPTIHVIGEVKNPGRHRYEEGLTIEKTLEKAGGRTDKGQTGTIRATQTDKDGNTGATRELGEKAAVLPGDIIVVEPSPQIGTTPKDPQQVPQGTTSPETPDTRSAPGSPAKAADSPGTPTEGK